MAISLRPNFSISRVSFPLKSKKITPLNTRFGVVVQGIPAGINVVTARVVPREQAPRDVLQLQQPPLVENRTFERKEFGLRPLRDEVDQSSDLQLVLVRDSMTSQTCCSKLVMTKPKTWNDRTLGSSRIPLNSALS